MCPVGNQLIQLSCLKMGRFRRIPIAIHQLKPFACFFIAIKKIVFLEIKLSPSNKTALTVTNQYLAESKYVISNKFLTQFDKHALHVAAARFKNNLSSSVQPI